LLYLLKQVISFLFIYVIYKPGRVLLRFIFYKIVVKTYRHYFFVARRIGLFSKENSFAVYLKQKMIHVILVLLTVSIVVTNFAQSTKAQSASSSAGKTILSSLVSSEFDSADEGQLIEEFFDQEPDISPEQQSYLNNLSTIRAQPSASTETANDSDNLTDENGGLTQEGSALKKPDMIGSEPLGSDQNSEVKNIAQIRKEVTYYDVQNGDTVSTIAQKFGINVSTILWENDLSAYSVIRPGDKLTILPTNGITHKIARGESLISIAKQYGIDEQKIIGINHLSNPQQIQIGEKLFIPDGKKIAYAPYKPTSYSGLNIIKDLVERTQLTKELKKPKSLITGGNLMQWPTQGHRITQYYSWKHHAIDIANHVGTPIYAADAGTIEYAGWGNGYGNQIVINHGGGKKTRYAHLSKFYCEIGDTVGKGEAIGAMGNTGWSTGPHLHFEIMIDGSKYNPLNYVK
jgi:LysM repeat protein